MPKGLASSATLASPRARRDRMARRVGSASAERRTVRLSSIANLLYNKPAMVKRFQVWPSCCERRDARPGPSGDRGRPRARRGTAAHAARGPSGPVTVGARSFEGLRQIANPASRQWRSSDGTRFALPERRVTVHSGDMGYTIGPFARSARCPGRRVTPWMSV